MMCELIYIPYPHTVIVCYLIFWDCLHRVWWLCKTWYLSSLGCAICCDIACPTHWFVGIVQCLRGVVMYRVMYKDAAHYVCRRNDIFYYVRRVPLDVTRHYASSRISFSLRTKSFNAALRTAHSVSQRLEDYWLGLRLQQMDVPAIHYGWRWWRIRHVHCDLPNSAVIN